jgi:drug/metabolite transporter (DMT)-like permease
MPRVRVWLAFLLLCLIWGSSYLFIRVGLRQLSPLALVALRLGSGAIAITAMSMARHSSLRVSRRVFFKLVIIATINTALPFLLIAWGEVTVPSGLASVLNSTVPIFSVLFAGAILHDEPLTPSSVGGVIIGFTGVVVLMSGDLSHGGIRWSSLAGQAAIVLSSVCYATGAVAVRRTLRGTASLTIATYSIWVSAIEIGMASAIFSPPDMSALSGTTILSVLWLGLLGSAVAYALAFFILEQWGASRYTLVAYLLPVTGLTLGAIFLAEALDWRMLVGSALVIMGVVLAGMVKMRHGDKQARLKEAGAPQDRTMRVTAERR